MPEVVEVYRVTGEDCFIVRCAIADPSELEPVVDALAVHGPVITSLVLSNPVRKIVPVHAGAHAATRKVDRPDTNNPA
jgi:Lrp/AsnC family leucine-responsive transcriptional regulator